ncbi:hypothetical protein ABMY45_03005 [Pseudoalteromonas sp. XMcav11-Q]
MNIIYQLLQRTDHAQLSLATSIDLTSTSSIAFNSDQKVFQTIKKRYKVLQNRTLSLIFANLALALANVNFTLLALFLHHTTMQKKQDWKRTDECDTQFAKKPSECNCHLGVDYFIWAVKYI